MNRSYDFDVLFGAGGVQVFVDNVLEIDYSGPVSDGAFGFYGFNQSNSVYSLNAVTPVPVPAALPLLMAGLGGLGAWVLSRGASARRPEPYHSVEVHHEGAAARCCGLFAWGPHGPARGR